MLKRTRCTAYGRGIHAGLETHPGRSLALEHIAAGVVFDIGIRHRNPAHCCDRLPATAARQASRDADRLTWHIWYSSSYGD